ncbi:spherulation-specific family 4 protein [Streptomyces lonarensis]|uniref:Phage tail protein n=1 Tax=Streptomyces lonarensis TaxID=700599 RepID=A0A7X6CZI6_9ACTN|nr:spherulation-specific family 4 protein [Streptomyces lonarensis]NJQ05436.1 phage tail protein [Streptomyces lonarensis]
MPDVTLPRVTGILATQPVVRPPTGAGLVAPGFAHPMVAPLEWAELARSDIPVRWAVLDVANGPGLRPDRFAASACAALRVRGRTVLGRLALGGGTRRPAEVLADAERHLSWYRVQGFHLAEVPSSPEGLDAVRRVTRALRGLAPGARIVLDHGRHPYEGYAELGDQLVTFRGRWRDYRWSQVPGWTARYPAERFCHAVCEVPPTRLAEALRVARWQGAATYYLTDRSARHGGDPWSSLPGFWDALVSCVGTAVSE